MTKDGDMKLMTPTTQQSVCPCQTSTVPNSVFFVDATATPSSLIPVKSTMVYLSGAGLPRMSWKKGR